MAGKTHLEIKEAMQEVDNLVNFMRGGWGGIAVKVTEAQVKAVRDEASAHH
jgi:hypothetical protein